MGRYIIRKLAYGFLVLWGVVTLVFAIFNINPGDPARMLLGQRVDEASLAKVRKELGLDLPWHKQYLLYLNDVSPLSLHKTAPEESHLYLQPGKYSHVTIFHMGQAVCVLKWPYLRRSYQSRKQVTTIIREALPGTVVLAVCAISFALLFGIFGGVVAALNKDRFIDGFSLLVAVLGMSAPSFFAAIIISWLGGYVWAAQTSLPAIPIVFGLGGLLLSLAPKRESAPKEGRVNFSPSGKSRGRSLLRSTEMLLKGLLLGLVVHLLHGAYMSFTGNALIPGAEAALHLPGTGLNMTGSLYDVDLLEGEYLALHNLILPMITLGIRPLAVVVQLTRNAMLDVMNQDFIRTARAKGLSEYRIVVGHALRNALNPVVTAISGWFASMLAGAVFIEFIFNWKGLGLQVFNSLQNDDYPVVMGSVLVIAATFVLINILVDVVYALIDPRIRLS